MAMYQTSCGQDSCQCSFLFWDLDLAKAWLSTMSEYLGLAKKPRQDVVITQLLQPWKLTQLQEHEKCFQQWTVVQLWIGIISTLVIFAMNFIWFLAEDNELAKPPLGTIFVNAIVGLLMTCFFTHLAWFGVVKKHGCCCLALCCCLGQPNLLVVAILHAIFAILAIVAAVQALGSVKGAIIVAVLIGAFCALVHGIALLYVGLEAFMVWRLSSSESPAAKDSSEAKTGPVVLGAPQVIHASQKPSTDLETGEKAPGA
jgi:magnesium-transporting ATPase (P-type)